MKSIIYSVVAIFTLVCFAQAQQAPDSVSVAYDSNPSSLQLRAQTGPNNSVTLTWRGDPTSPGFTVYESIGHHGTYRAIVTVGPNVQSYTQSGFAVGVGAVRVARHALGVQRAARERLARPHRPSRHAPHRRAGRGGLGERRKEPHRALKWLRACAPVVVLKSVIELHGKRQTCAKSITLWSLGERLKDWTA